MEAFLVSLLGAELRRVAQAKYVGARSEHVTLVLASGRSVRLYAREVLSTDDEAYSLEAEAYTGAIDTLDAVQLGMTVGWTELLRRDEWAEPAAEGGHRRSAKSTDPTSNPCKQSTMLNDDTPIRQIDPTILERLGKFVTVWSLLESMVADLFVAIIKSDIGNLMVVTQSVSANTISNWIRTAIEFRHTPPDVARKICEILNEYDELRAERNVLIHGLWGTDKSGSGTVMVQTIRLDRRVPAVDRLITVADLDDLINVTLSIYTQLLTLMRAHKLPYRGA